jgi:hypothetical protein
VPAAAYYLRGDECPRCLTAMTPAPPRKAASRPPAVPREQPQQPAVAGD